MSGRRDGPGLPTGSGGPGSDGTGGLVDQIDHLD